MLWYLSLLMAPPIVYLIPYFILLTRLQLRGSYFSMVLILQTLTMPMSIWLLKGFIDEVPVELEEAVAVLKFGLAQFDAASSLFVQLIESIRRCLRPSSDFV